MAGHRIDLSEFSRADLKRLADDVAQELNHRETEDRHALETKLRNLVEEHGFDPKDLHFAGNGRRGSRKPRKNGDRDDH